MKQHESASMTDRCGRRRPPAHPMIHQPNPPETPAAAKGARGSASTPSTATRKAVSWSVRWGQWGDITVSATTAAAATPTWPSGGRPTGPGTSARCDRAALAPESNTFYRRYAHLHGPTTGVRPGQPADSRNAAWPKYSEIARPRADRGAGRVGETRRGVGRGSGRSMQSVRSGASRLRHQHGFTTVSSPVASDSNLVSHSELSMSRYGGRLSIDVISCPREQCDASEAEAIAGAALPLAALGLR